MHIYGCVTFYGTLTDIKKITCLGIPVAVTRVIQLLLRSTEYCTHLINLDSRKCTMLLLKIYYQTKDLIMMKLFKEASWLHRASMISNTFIVQLMHTTLKNVFIKTFFSSMFRLMVGRVFTVNNTTSIF